MSSLFGAKTAVEDQAVAEAEAPKKAKAPKAKKEPKMWPQWNEDGTPQLGEDGEQVTNLVRMKKPRLKKPRLDAEGNPIPRRSNVYLETQVIKRTEKAETFKCRAESKRGDMFAAATDGITVGKFYEAMGGKSVAHTFLVWFVNEAEVLDVI